MPVCMSNFVRFEWKNLIEVNFIKCGINDQDFSLFVNHISQYPFIKLLYLCKIIFIDQLTIILQM